jgi:hypothetical protein
MKQRNAGTMMLKTWHNGLLALRTNSPRCSPTMMTTKLIKSMLQDDAGASAVLKLFQARPVFRKAHPTTKCIRIYCCCWCWCWSILFKVKIFNFDGWHGNTTSTLRLSASFSVVVSLLLLSIHTIAVDDNGKQQHPDNVVKTLEKRICC